MQINDLEHSLRAWGRVYGPQPESEWEEDSSHGSGALTGCLIEFLRVGIVTGSVNERVVIKKQGSVQEQVLVGRLTAKGKQSQGGAKPMKAHPMADYIDHMVCVIQKTDVRAAISLRAQYCLRGMTAREKCLWVSKMTNTRVSRMGFRAALSRGKIALQASIFVKKAV